MPLVDVDRREVASLVFAMAIAVGCGSPAPSAEVSVGETRADLPFMSGPVASAIDRTQVWLARL